eukprot:TRINITY_DN5766_c0_g1_i1.p1 TRINITY_DN5766_c0_g1~~TRINITY_DN5766_c0_g1_i1.p1  ORF type:complete len:225 (+),score=17.56 TRINITY_DN5766_c0_g1_i1:59-733(+)
MIGFEISAMETMITPLTYAEYGWKTMENSLLFAGLALTAVLSIIATIYLNKLTGFANPRWIFLLGVAFFGASLVWGVVLCGPGDIKLWCLFTFGGLFMFGMPMLSNANISLYSILVGNQPQGAFLGYRDIFQGVGRILGAVFAGWSMHHLEGSDDNGNPQYYYTFGLFLLIFAIVVLALPLVWKRINVIDLQNLEEEEEGSLRKQVHPERLRDLVTDKWPLWLI